jgi:hypothetical protein
LDSTIEQCQPDPLNERYRLFSSATRDSSLELIRAI